MLMVIWNILRGFVRIEVKGFSVERFINMATYRGTLIWDVERTEAGAAMCVSVKGFRLIRDIGRKTQCKVRIIGKTGLPFMIFKYRKKKFLAFGLIAFVGLLYFLSSFVWLVHIEGNVRTESEAIAAYLKENGLAQGSFKRSLEIKELERGLLFAFSDISFVHIKVEGTRCVVKIAETIPKKEIVDKETPCSIVADKDAVIVSVATQSGAPKVKPGDVVKKGQTLVSGELSITAEGLEVGKDYVHSYADVRAKVYYEIVYSVPFKYTVGTYTGKKKTDYAFRIMDIFINLRKVSIFFENYDKITDNVQWGLGKDYPIPAQTVVTTYREFTVSERERTPEEAKELAIRQLDGRIIREFDDEVEIENREIVFSEDSDNLYVRAVLTAIEKIGVEEEITAEPLNEQPATP